MKLVSMGDLAVRIAGGTDGDGGGRGPVVVLMHGFGAPGDDLVPLAGAFEQPAATRFVFPAAPLDLGFDGVAARAWWWIDLPERSRLRALGQKPSIDEVPRGLDVARAHVEALLDEVARTLQPPPGKIALGGFSQGAMLALDVALRSAHPLAGLVLFSGTHMAAREWAPLFERRRGLPVLMSHGSADEILPFDVSDALRSTLTAAGIPVEWVPFRGGHGIPPQVVAQAGKFLRRVLSVAGDDAGAR
jgi:phospholipase/carboxylesterase